MSVNRRHLLGAGLALATLPLIGLPALAADDVIRIGVITDMSGPYRDVQGPTSVAAAKQAAAEFMAENPDIKVEVIAADHQNKADVGVSVIREWFDQGGVDMITDIGNSSLALAARSIVESKDKVAIVTSAGSSDLTGKSCSPNLLHWGWDSWAVAHSTGSALVKDGGDKWFFITPDYAYGHAQQADTTKFVEAAGGKVVGAAVYPFPGTTDFSAYLLQAQASGANVIGFTSSGADLGNGLKQAQEFGLPQTGIKQAAMIGYINDVMGIGLDVAGGLNLTETFYWDLNDRTRAFMERIKPSLPANTFPNMSQAGNYSGVLHYLKAVKAVGVEKAKASGTAVLDAMKAMPTDDDAFGPGMIRPDGRKIHPAYLFKVKTAAESTGPGDVYTLISVTPADQAFRPMSEGGCPLVKP
ncbi:ABC transporter substrate-binding protein [Segnochrobactraceae bacterium EtOH-i3]